MQKDARHEAIVRMILDRQVADRNAREKRLSGYRPCADRASTAAAPVRLHKFATAVPCRVTAQAYALLETLEKQFAGCTVTFPHDGSGSPAIMLTTANGAKSRQIGWLDQRAQAGEHGLIVDTDGGSMLVLEFRYPPTPVQLSLGKNTAPDGDAITGDCAEIRAALDIRTPQQTSSPQLVWATRPEVEAMDDVGFRDFESFYVQFKHEV